MQKASMEILIRALLNQADMAGELADPQSLTIRPHNDMEGYWVAEFGDPEDPEFSEISDSPEAALEELAATLAEEGF